MSGDLGGQNQNKHIQQFPVLPGSCKGDGGGGGRGAKGGELSSGLGRANLSGLMSSQELTR